MKETTFVCIHCGREFPMTERREFGGQDYCRACLDEITLICFECGTRIAPEDNCGDSDTPLCERCYDRDYTHCDHCGRLIRYDDARYAESDEDEDYPMCDHCYTTRCCEAIHDYYYKPEPIFYGNGPRYYGVELEIDGAGELGRNAQTVMDVGNADGLDHIYCKHDGSLDDGFEIVSHPMSMDYHMNTMPWAEVIAKSRELGYTSHKAGTCGLHVHVSRNAFGNTEEEQDAVVARILYFFEKHWEELLKFSRRTQHQLDQWAARYGYKNEPLEILDDAKRKNARGRYTAVNLTNRDTIEFRMFRGTLKLNTFLATLQLLDRICDVALSLSDDELKAMPWSTFVGGCTAPELVQYLKERRLYVNEPVECDEEDN